MGLLWTFDGSSPIYEIRISSLKGEITEEPVMKLSRFEFDQIISQMDYLVIASISAETVKQRKDAETSLSLLRAKLHRAQNEIDKTNHRQR